MTISNLPFDGFLTLKKMLYSTFSPLSISNSMATFGADFRASESAVTSLNGPGVAIACSFGCLLTIPLCRYWRRRTVYLMAGVGSAVCAVAMGLLPHTVLVYAVGLLAYNFCQGFNYASFTALEMEIVGPGNAVSGTMMAMLTASANIPISSMTWLDSHLHDSRGLRAMFFADAGASILTAALLMLLVLPLLDRAIRKPA